jgi:cell division protein FtsB
MRKKKRRLFAAIGATVLLIGLLLPGYTKLQDLKAKNSLLEDRINELTSAIEELEVEREKLENDILYIEKVAREKLGVAREDEVVIKEKE